jgi:purine-binding chemotaxis protein CheW
MNEQVLDLDRYLVFILSGDTYATPLMDVREVVELQEPKQIPFSGDSYLGVIDIRGEIIGVIDLRLKLGYEARPTSSEALMVFDTQGVTIAAVVDSMDGVVRILPEHIDHNVSVASRLPLGFLMGVARIREKLVTMIDLTKVVEREEMRLIAQSSSKAS